MKFQQAAGVEVTGQCYSRHSQGDTSTPHSSYYFGSRDSITGSDFRFGGHIPRSYPSTDESSTKVRRGLGEMICIATVADPFDWYFPQDDYDSYDSDYPYPQSYLPHVQGGISMVRSTTHFYTTLEQWSLTPYTHMYTFMLSSTSTGGVTTRSRFLLPQQEV